MAGVGDDLALLKQYRLRITGKCDKQQGQYFCQDLFHNSRVAVKRN